MVHFDAYFLIASATQLNAQNNLYHHYCYILELRQIIYLLCVCVKLMRVFELQKKRIEEFFPINYVKFWQTRV